VSCGEHHVGAVSEVGVLYTWGRGTRERWWLMAGCVSLVSTPIDLLVLSREWMAMGVWWDDYY
jgi:hypothetical protein